MKLKEKFINIIFNYIGSEWDRRDVSNDLEKISYEFAIDFAEWLINNYYTNPNFEYKTTKELLEIYKLQL